MTSAEKRRWEALLPGTREQKREMMGQIQRAHEIDAAVRGDVSNLVRLMDQDIQMMHQWLNNEDEFQASAQSFRAAVESAEMAAIPIPPAQADKAASIFIAKIHRQGDGSFLNRSFFIRFMAAHSASGQTRRFLEERLSRRESIDRQDVLHGLYAGSVFKSDPEMSETLRKLFDEGSPRDYSVLAVLARINPGKAIPIINSQVKSVRSINDFNAIASIACMTREPAALDSIIDRALEFPRAPAGSDASPTLGIYAEQLLDYVRIAEDARLEKSLKLLLMTGGARLQSLGTVLNKLNSSSPRSRRAAFDYLGATFRDGDFLDPDVLARLKESLRVERSSEVRESAEAAIRDLDSRIHPR